MDYLDIAKFGFDHWHKVKNYFSYQSRMARKLDPLTLASLNSYPIKFNINNDRPFISFHMYVCNFSTKKFTIDGGIFQSLTVNHKMIFNNEHFVKIFKILPLQPNYMYLETEISEKDLNRFKTIEEPYNYEASLSLTLNISFGSHKIPRNYYLEGLPCKVHWSNSPVKIYNQMLTECSQKDCFVANNFKKKQFM